MDVITSVRSCLSSWTNGGESECRNILISPHCNPSDPNCADVLTTAYHTLLCSTLSTWSPKDTFTADAFLAFVQSVLDGLPSSSTSSTNSFNTALFGEIVVDMVWSIDAELDEILADAKVAIVNVEQGSESALKVKQYADQDKETLAYVVKKLLVAGTVNATFCRERLEMALVDNVGLIADKAAFEKKEIRTRTGLFYKQNKFNLLREQSEGYSKLTAELTSNLSAPHNPATGYPTESYASIEDRARPVWEKVISLIGYFDLDPNRALDVILDVLSVHLATHYSFFLALLSFSPWSVAYKPPNGSSIAFDPVPDQYKGRSLDEVLSLAEARHGNEQDCSRASHTSTNPRVMAQVLGFKFGYYQSPDVSDGTPKNLYLTAALLIREGFIALEDLYPHMSPGDAEMEQVHKVHETKVKERISGAKISQLAMAAPLEAASTSSSSKPRPSTPAESKKPVEIPDIPPQKVGLLSALLAIGALRPAIAIMSKFPWVVDAYPEIADLMLRVMKHSISPLYESTMVTKERNPSFTQPRARYGAGGVSVPPSRKPQLTLWAPTPPSTHTTDFVFFFPDWALRVPLCSSLDDLVDVIEPLMRFIGLHISRDPLFVTKFTRLGRTHLISTMPLDPETKKPSGELDPGHPIRQFWLKALRLYLLPALPLIRGNAVCTVEVWNIIRQYETTVRWRLYGEWKTTTYQSHPELRIRQVQADRESKGILRRLSHNTIDSLSGTVAKLAHSNPCIFFTVAVGQIMAYDNLANVVIQALRYVTNMGFDVLVFIILDALANPHKERVKDDGVNTSDWLQSLASFTGMLFRRYSADLSPVLKYIVHQLYSGQTTEIVVLRELIWKMAGIEPLPDLSDSQISAMAGGPTLRVEAVASDTRGARLDPGDAVLKGPQRLGKALLDSSLALPLLIQVAQQRQACVFRAPDAHLKSLASLYDTTHGVLLQYLELLTTPAVVSSLDYSQKVLPPLAELGEKYGICAPVCMQIIRPMLNGLLLKAALAFQEQERVANEEEEKRLKAALKAKREPSAATSRVSSPSIGATSLTRDTPVEPKPSVLETNSTEDVSMEMGSPASPWLPELSAIFDDIKKIAPGNAYDVMGPGFYVTFWQLSTYDLVPPGAKYDEEVFALRALSRQEDSKYIAADRSADRAKRLTASSHRARRGRYNDFVNLLAQEYKEQAASRVFTIKRLAREKQHWFAGGVKALTLVSSVIEHCIQPRSLLSPMDADFCAQFIKVLHTQGTPGFSTLMCYDKLLGDHVKVVVFSCSEYEARNYGRFLVGILKDLWKWQQDEELYKQENRTKTGGKTVLLPGMQMKWSNKTIITPEDLLSWPALKTIMKKWHRKLGKCLLDCIQTGDFMHVYNAIIVLKEILPVFPLSACTDVGPVLDQVMQTFLEKEERGDLKILGRAYAASLKKRETLWAVAKPPVPKPTGAPTSPKPSTLSSAPLSNDKTRINSIPSGPASATAGDTRRSSSSTTTPSAPRAQLASTNGASQMTSDRPSDTRLAMGSIPRPEVVKRVRPDKSSQSPRPDSDASLKLESMDVDRKPATAPPTSTNNSDLRTSTKNVSATIRKDISLAKDSSRPQTPNPSATNKEPPQSPRSHRALEDKQPRVEKVMPPPSAPSQTLSAQELRETAKQSIGNRPDKFDDRPARSSNDSRSQNGSANASPVPRRRSPSPPTGPGTRNGSADSRASGGRPRSDRGSGDSNDRLEDKKSNRDSRQESHGSTAGRRDSRSERGGRERNAAREAEKDKEAERDRDKDRIRDRHGDKEKERERDKDKDRRERDRERDRERERDRDRDRDRDRHRRDDKDRDRDTRKERDLVSRDNPAVTPGPDSRGLPIRPDTSRHRDLPNGDEALGKRRRPADDEPERTSKRSSRKDSHRDDRSRRPAEKESHDRTRESDRRRADRNASETDGRGSERSGDKRVPEGLPSSKTLPPSAPRAMSSTETPRGPKTDSAPARDRDWKAQRDVAPHLAAGGSSAPEIAASSGSLRSRISDKESPRSLGPAPANSYRPEPVHKDDDRDNSRKRTVSERERDASDSASGAAAEQTAQPQKRPRINRNRYQSSHGNSYAIAKKLLPTDPQAGDKTRSGRKD